MRILALSTWWPEPADNGSRLRIAHLLRALATRHEVHLLALTQEPITSSQIDAVRSYCASVESRPERHWTPRRGEQIASLWHATPSSLRATWDPEFAAMVQRQVAVLKPDLVIAFALRAAVYAPLAGAIPCIFEEVEIGNYHTDVANAATPRRKLRSWLTLAKHRNFMRRLMAQFDGVTVVSEAEAALVQPLLRATTRLAVIANGADVAGCAPFISEPEPATLIYPGALSFDPNFDAMQFFLSDIFPLIRAQRPDVHLRITGKAHPERQAALPQHAGVEYTGYVTDVRPLIARSWATVIPLRYGGGTRLKALESIALGTPLVTTPKGIEGLAFACGQQVLCAEQATDFARATLQLLGDATLRRQLAASAQVIVAEQYDWRAIGSRLADLGAAVVAAGHRAGRQPLAHSKH